MEEKSSLDRYKSRLFQKRRKHANLYIKQFEIYDIMSKKKERKKMEFDTQIYERARYNKHILLFK